MNLIYKRTVFPPRFWVLGYQRTKIWDGSEYVDRVWAGYLGTKNVRPEFWVFGQYVAEHITIYNFTAWLFKILLIVLQIGQAIFEMSEAQMKMTTDRQLAK